MNATNFTVFDEVETLEAKHGKLMLVRKFIMIVSIQRVRHD